MTVFRLRRYLEELLAENRSFDAQVVNHFKKLAGDWFGVSEAEVMFLAEQVLGRQGQRFADETTRRDLEIFLAEAAKCKRPLMARLLEIPAALPGLCNLLVEALLGQWGEVFRDGRATPEYLAKVREEAAPRNFRGKASLSRIDPQAAKDEIVAALRQTIRAIDGFAFLSRPPAGRAANEHIILIKVGVNWGQFGYPTVTSAESVYALTRICFEEAAARGAALRVIVGDESGIEIKLWGGKTMDNLEHTGILHEAVLAGLEQAASREEEGAEIFRGAGELLAALRRGHRMTQDSETMINMARRAGVQVVAFEEVEKTTIPVPGARHFTAGIPVPKLLAAEVTDIINLPKPPGRHLIMGNTGLTGALKNHIGLLDGAARSPGLHGRWQRYPKPREGQSDTAYIEDLKAQREAIIQDKSGASARRYLLNLLINQEAYPPALPFHEKIAELYLACAAKERFSAVDMRRTVSSLGPDIGDFMDIGAVLAASDPVTLDVIAGALLKQAYGKTPDILAVLPPGGDSLWEFLMGRTWLQHGTPFDLLSHIAANSYGIGPLDAAHLDLVAPKESGFHPGELDDLISYLQTNSS